jgi:hypothetical protein
MEQQVTPLRPEEPARFNPERLERLCDEIGEVRAEHEVARSLESISAQISDIQRLPVGDGGQQLAMPVRALAVSSERIGMATLARVAGDVLSCISRQDEVALAATRARLLRVGERSMHAIWDLEDLSG